MNLDLPCFMIVVKEPPLTSGRAGGEAAVASRVPVGLGTPTRASKSAQVLEGGREGVECSRVMGRMGEGVDGAGW